MKARPCVENLIVIPQPNATNIKSRSRNDIVCMEKSQAIAYFNLFLDCICQTMTYWLFLGNPKYYRIIGSIRDSLEDSLACNTLCKRHGCW
ncbi:MAG: hypothetical protein ICV85_21205 [Tolypothrix sp. T3-bin4]|nr:hypothetical protein [Tolypothrix sp. T3-bin4]